MNLEIERKCGTAGGLLLLLTGHRMHSQVELALAEECIRVLDLLTPGAWNELLKSCGQGYVDSYGGVRPDKDCNCHLCVLFDKVMEVTQ